MINVLEEFGFKVNNKRELKKTGSIQTGQCRQLLFLQEDYSCRVSVPFYRSISVLDDLFNMGHEDMHAIQFLGLLPAFDVIEKRLTDIGIHLKL